MNIYSAKCSLKPFGWPRNKFLHGLARSTVELAKEVAVLPELGINWSLQKCGKNSANGAGPSRGSLTSMRTTWTTMTYSRSAGTQLFTLSWHTKKTNWEMWSMKWGGVWCVSKDWMQQLTFKKVWDSTTLLSSAAYRVKTRTKLRTSPVKWGTGNIAPKSWTTSTVPRKHT